MPLNWAAGPAARAAEALQIADRTRHGVHPLLAEVAPDQFERLGWPSRPRPAHPGGTLLSRIAAVR